MSNDTNRYLTRTMLGLEVYEMARDGSRRYLSVDEIRRDISFVGGRFVVNRSDTGQTIASKIRTSYPALTGYVDANMVRP